jgi:hypothetical protein
MKQATVDDLVRELAECKRTLVDAYVISNTTYVTTLLSENGMKVVFAGRSLAEAMQCFNAAGREGSWATIQKWIDGDLFRQAETMNGLVIWSEFWRGKNIIG